MTNDILLFTLEMESASQEIRLLGGRVTQQFTNHVFVAILPDISDTGKLRHSRQQPYGPLDEISKLAADAWNSFQAKLLAGKDLVSPTEGLRWDAPGFQPPLKLGPSSNGESAISLRHTGTPTSLYLIGSVALGLVIVAGNTRELGFSHEEYVKVVAEVMEGLQFLVHAEPLAKVSFIYNIHLLSIEAVPNNNCGDTAEFCEAIWRDPALNQLGYPSGIAGCTEYAADLKGFNNTDWACIGFFTKYPLFHFAYARSVQTCMQYANGSWGPDNIHRVFAHEVCHIFGAADEYSNKKTQCTCKESGYLKIPNTNCVNCPGNHVPCLMDANTLNFCQWTRQQLGWSSRFFNPVLLKQILPICDTYNDMYVWGVDIDNTVYLRYRFNGQWTIWQPDWYNAPRMRSITPLHDDTDNIHLFGVRPDNTVYLNKRIGALWSGWNSWYGAPRVQSIDAFKDGDNNLYVFGFGTDNSVYLNRHAGDHWSGWQPNWQNAPKMKSISAVHDRQNNLYIFGIATDNTVYLNKHERDSWSGWRHDWENAPSLISVLPVIDADNNVYAFGVGTDYTVYVNVRSGGQWSGWQLNWGNVDHMRSFGSATDIHGTLYVWGIGVDGTSYLNYRYKGKWMGWHAQWGRPSDFIDPNLYFITAVFDKNNNPHVWGIGINNNAKGNNHVEYFNWRKGEEWSGWLYQWGM